MNGWRPVQAHAAGSHGARLYIQMLEQVMKEGNYTPEYIRSLRTTLEHNFFLGNKGYFGNVEFLRDEDENITGFRVSNGRVRNLLFVKQHTTKDKLH